MLDYNLTIRPEDVTGWESSILDKITLPYVAGNNVYFHAGEMIATHVGDTKDYDTLFDYSTVKAVLKILPYRSRLLAGIKITVDLPDGTRLERKISGNTETKTIENILDQYFSLGAPGLSSTYREYWHKTYMTYKQRMEQGERKTA